MTSPTSKILRTITPAVATLALSGAGIALLGSTEALAIMAAVTMAVLVVTGFYAFRALSRPLGRLTAAAAFSAAGAFALGTWAALAPNCPDALTPGRCSASEISTWMLNGALLPLGYLIALGVPLFVAGFVGRATRNGARSARSALRARGADRSVPGE